MTVSNYFVCIAITSVGRGVLASRTIFAGQIVGEVTGTVIPTNGCDYDEDYCIDLDEHSVLEPAPPFRFLNHSCEPNCEVFGYDDDISDKSLWLEAIRRVEAGEELTIDYGWPAEGAIECRCGSSSCRGWIVAESELERLHDIGSAPSEPPTVVELPVQHVIASPEQPAGPH